MEKIRKKILVIGIKGMAGHMIFKYLKETKLFDVYGIARNITGDQNVFNIDVSDIESLEIILKGKEFDSIINCIGILNKDAEDNPSKAIWLNSYFPHYLEAFTKNSSTKIFHISTDCVFSGSKGGYTELDSKDGIGFYAQSKALGEIINDKDLTIRTSIIGPELNTKGIGLFHWFMSQSLSSKLNGYSKAYWSGITTLELAKVIIEAIQQDICGLIQIAPNEKIDKFSLICLFNKIYRDEKVIINPTDKYSVDKSLKSIRYDFDYNVSDYTEMLIEQKKWIEKHRELYPSYV